MHDHAREGFKACPVLHCPIVGLRVIERIGDSLIDVVRPMTLPVALEWQPQRQGNDGDQPVEAVPAGRVPVHDLMLQRAVQRDQHRGDRGHDRQRPVAVSKGNREPSAIGDQDDQQRRHFHRHTARVARGACGRVRFGCYGEVV